jgi:hypothetical protein
MSYNTAGLKLLTNSGHVNIWVLDTDSAVGDADADNFISDAGVAGAGKGVVGRGMKVGDMVFVRVYSSGTAAAPTAFSDTGWYYVTAVDATTGAGTIAACGAA